MITLTLILLIVVTLLLAIGIVGVLAVPLLPIMVFIISDVIVLKAIFGRKKTNNTKRD